MTLVKFITATIICLGIIGCSISDRENPYGAVNYQSDHMNLAVSPKYNSVAILPFENKTRYKTAPIQARRIFFGNFAATKNYVLQPIRETDRLLKEHHVKAEEITDKNYKRLGQALGCDMLIFGRVNEYFHKYRVVYSQTLVDVVIVAVDAKTGKKVWWSQDAREQKYGGIDPYALYVAHKNEYMWSRNILNRYDELFRDMMLVFPDRPVTKKSKK